MTPDLLLAAQIHASEEYPGESCGVIVGTPAGPFYHPCRNISQLPDECVWNPRDLARAEDDGELLGYVHSHPDAPAVPSLEDKRGCEASGRPWWIISQPGGHWRRIDPFRGLEGRPFVFGVDDCYSLVRDWYREALGLTLPDFVRRPYFWDEGETPHLDNLQRAGFELVHDDLRIGDVLLLKIKSQTPNHCGVYVGRGDILHHLPGRLSRREPLAPMRHKITHTVRFRWAA